MKTNSLLLSLFLCVACQSEKVTESGIELLDRSAFETTCEGKAVDLYTLTNKSGMALQVTNFGGRVVSLWASDRKGVYADVVMGYDSISKYIHNTGPRFLGAAIGRYANRIANGEFTIDGVNYTLPRNNNGQSLHGGEKGFDGVVWEVDSVKPNKIYLSYLSKDGEEGFPGNLLVKMEYELSEANEFIINYRATTDKATPVNLTHHSFFNLKGEGNGTINDHILTINADAFTPVDSVLIPLGENSTVAGTPFDFRTPVAVGVRVNDPNEQLRMGAGYDHNFVLNRQTEAGVELAATVLEPESGRYMEVWTSELCMQFYGGNFFDGKSAGKYGGTHDYRGSFALETQHFPDAPNQKAFPSAILYPGEVYEQTCIYKFSTR